MLEGLQYTNLGRNNILILFIKKKTEIQSILLIFVSGWAKMFECPHGFAFHITVDYILIANLIAEIVRDSYIDIDLTTAVKIQWLSLGERPHAFSFLSYAFLQCVSSLPLWLRQFPDYILQSIGDNVFFLFSRSAPLSGSFFLSSWQRTEN